MFVSSDRDGITYFRVGDDLFGKLSGIDDPSRGKKRRVYETADELGFNDPAGKVAHLMRKFGQFDVTPDQARVLAATFGFLTFDEMFKQVILKMKNDGTPLITFYVSGLGKGNPGE